MITAQGRGTASVLVPQAEPAPQTGDSGATPAYSSAGARPLAQNNTFNLSKRDSLGVFTILVVNRFLGFGFASSCKSAFTHYHLPHAFYPTVEL